jgi:hypothetical protein
MGMVDFSAYKMNPWDSYEKNREYLLRRAGLEEDVAARQQRGDVANRQIALGHEQLGVEKSRVRESGRRTDIMAQEQDRLDRVYDAKQKQAVFEGKRAMFSYLANVPNVATAETWPMFKERIEGMFTEQVKSKGLSPEAERAAINDVLEAIPQTLEEAKSEQSVNALFQLAGESNMEPVFIANPDGSAPEVIMVKKGEGISPEQLKGKIPFKDYPSFSLAKQGYENTVEALSKAMEMDKDRINNYILGFRTLTAPFAEPGEQVTNIFDQGGMPTAQFQALVSRALKFYSDHVDATPEEKAQWDNFTKKKFESASKTQELFAKYMNEPSYVDMLNSRGRGKKAEGPAKDFINQYIKAGGGDGVDKPKGTLQSSHKKGDYTIGGLKDTELKSARPDKKEESEGLTDAFIDEDGTLWAKKKGQLVRVAVKPPERIYGGRYENPEYDKYLETIKRLNAKQR